jgi:AbiV family abortive infection protein
MTPFEPTALMMIEACRNHAQDLYGAAALLKEQGLPNVAYHLATLALEELGKAQLIGMRSMSKRDDADAWYDKQLEDHVKKLFWALWGRLFGRRPDRKEIDSLRGLATIIHGNRLRGLYVSTDAAQFVTPKESVGEDLLTPLMSLVEARLGMEPHLTGVEYDAKDLELLNWFSAASDDPEKRGFIFSAESFDKMEALGGREWITWLKTELEASAATAMASLEKEMKRGQPEESEALQDKWQLKIRLFSQSHSIRGKDLNRWNDRVTWLKLYPVDNKKDQILVELRLPKIVSLQAVWYAGFGYSNALLTALNIASGGLFWWQQPGNLSRFYENLMDVETNMKAEIRRSPELKIGWPRAVLDSDTLDRVVVAFVAMPQPDDRLKHEPFNHYLTGVAYLAKTDVFLQFEIQAYGAFLASLAAALRIYRADLGHDFAVAFSRIMAELTADEAFQKKHADLIASYNAHSLTLGAITLSEVVEMKCICDATFMGIFVQVTQERAQQEPNSGD